MIFRIALASDGKNIYVTKMSKFLRFKEEKIAIERIKPALETKVPKKWHRLGKPIMIDNQIFLLFKDWKGGEVFMDKKEIFEAVLMGQCVFVGEEESDINKSDDSAILTHNI